MLRKTIAMIMAIAIVGGTMCTTATVNEKNRFTAVAADEIIEPDEEGIVTKDGVKYEVSEKDASIVGYTNDLKGDLVIPEKINGLPVTGIDYYAFENCAGITSVTIPASVELISQGAFSNCANLTSVNFEGSYFKKTDKLKKYLEAIGENLDSFKANGSWKGIFLCCPKLEKVSCPAENSVSMSRFFFNYVGYDISKDDTISDDYLVVDYDRPTAGRMDPIVIPKSFKTVSITEGETLSRSIFSNIQTLETVSLPDSLKKIDDCAFWDCSNLKSIDIPKNVTDIGDSAFVCCSSIEEIEIPEKVETIGSGAFAGMGSLTSAMIPATVKTIGYNLLSNCDNLISIKIAGSPVISPDPENKNQNDENIGMATYCPKLETIETNSNVFKWINSKGEEKQISSKYAMFNEDNYRHREEDEDKYNVEEEFFIPKSLKSMTSSETEVICGDANLDGKVDISDAVLIMQSFSNPSKYKLSDEARTAADVAGNSDGVTNADALAIQKYLLKIISTLPDTE